MSFLRLRETLVKHKRLLCVCLGNCVISVGSTCFYYAELHHLNDYPSFAVQLNAVLGIVVAAVGLLVSRVICKRDGIGQSDTDFPSPTFRQWLSLACFLAAQNTLEIASIQQIGDDNLPPILQQSVVPLSFVISSVMLRSKYTRAQLFGAALVVVGVIAGFLPTVWGGNRTSVIHVGWVLVFILSRVPQAFANVFAEGMLRGSSHMSWAFKVTLYVQFIALPLNFVSSCLLELVRTGDAGRVFVDYGAGAKCLFQGVGGSKDECATAWRSVLLFAVPGAFYLISEFQVVQIASATTFFLLAALQLPIQDFLLSLPIIMGDLHSTFHPSFAVSIVIVAAGLAVYGYGALSNSEQDPEPLILEEPEANLQYAQRLSQGGISLPEGL